MTEFKYNMGVVGGRKFNNYSYMKKTLDEYISIYGKPISIVSGGAVGADKLAEKYALDNKIPTDICLPEKKESYHYLKRNGIIVSKSNVILAFPDKDSRGTYDTINKARLKGVTCMVFKESMTPAG